MQSKGKLFGNLAELLERLFESFCINNHKIQELDYLRRVGSHLLGLQRKCDSEALTCQFAFWLFWDLGDRARSTNYHCVLVILGRMRCLTTSLTATELLAFELECDR
ncbi:MAG: hypothetical protein HWQ35_20870 [Nostoc sp. NMS1]|uniref:hypothetical protein n=1 Tax=unclassified Nostoc TaxID=2593658 RepID=UPI0025F6ED1B|nr:MULTISPECIES: hypothetical protein [unclassified Nostoc]MBN3908912.1 hypothetical protein [Nostoc sp. NMS1]MBN3990317.1 hypothetical protein [Nostoc sp. NMS2]